MEQDGNDQQFYQEEQQLTKNSLLSQHRDSFLNNWQVHVTQQVICVSAAHEGEQFLLVFDL